MEFVDRYVHAVKRHLPAAQQDDIVSELTDDILSEIKDRETELGRSLDEAEQEAVLKRYGHPFVLATRYMPQQHLIGPTAFPFYWATLKISLAIALGVHVIVAFATSFSQDAPHRALGRLMAFPWVGIQTFAWVTLAFAALDYSQARLRLFDNWTPRSLPPVPPRTASVNRTSRMSLIGEAFGSVIFIAWWLAIPSYPFLMMGPAAALLTLSPAWHRVYLVAALPAALTLVVTMVVLLRPSWTWLGKVRPLFVHGMTLVSVSILLKAGNLLIPATDRPNLDHLADLVNQGVVLMLLIVSIVATIQAMYEVVRLARGYAK